MEKLLQLSGLLFFLTTILVETQTAWAQDYCSLTVQVVDMNGKEVPEARIKVSERSGRTITLVNQPGGARFCDLGITPVTITVGDFSCNQVTVSNIGLEWGKPRTTRIIYDVAPCSRDVPQVAACEILFRFSDKQQAWIPGVSLMPPAPFSESPQSDSAGRMLIRLAAGKELRSFTNRSGYAQQEIHLTCKRELLHHEEAITLSREQ